MEISELAARLVDIPSVSGNEREIADFVEDRLRANPRLEVLRDGDSVLARTNLGRPGRVILAGHLDTVPIAANVPGRFIGDDDEATPATVQPFKDGIKGARWEIFEQSSHMPHVEEQEDCMRVVGDFLNQNDR